MPGSCVLDSRPQVRVLLGVPLRIASSDGIPGHVTRAGVRFSKQAWPDETLVTRVVVTGKWEDGDRRLVDVDCTLANTGGGQKVVGTATLEAPLIRRPARGIGLGNGLG
jgi:acyl dehydratase